jgi:hypothetical protein
MSSSTTFRGLKSTLDEVEQIMRERDKGTKGLFKKINASHIEPGVIAKYREKIIEYSQTFDVSSRVKSLEYGFKTSPGGNKNISYQYSSRG